MRMTTIKCDTCGIGPDGGADVFRINAKGVPGIWRCVPCGATPPLASSVEAALMASKEPASD